MPVTVTHSRDSCWFRHVPREHDTNVGYAWPDPEHHTLIPARARTEPAARINVHQRDSVVPETSQTYNLVQQPGVTIVPICKRDGGSE